MTEDRSDLRYFLVLLAGLTLIRLAVLKVAPFPITPDEAQYWLFAQSPDWGYYSKPPLLAWLIALSTSVFGDGPFGIRVFIPLLHAATALLIFHSADRLFGPRIAFWSGLLYITLPGVSFSSGVASTDPPMMLGWALAVYALVRLHDGNHFGWSALFGVGLGLSLLGKYTGVALIASALLYGMTGKYGRQTFSLQIILPALIVTGLLLLPHLWWNWENSFVTLTHLADNANLQGNLFQPANMLGFVASQFAVFGPIPFAVLIVLILRWPDVMRGNDPLHFTLCFVAPLLAVILIQALASRAHANWAAPVYITAAIAVAAWALGSGRDWIVTSSLMLHLTVALMMVAGTLMLDSGSLPIWADPAKKFRWAEQTGQRVVANIVPGETLLAADRKLMALMLYHTRIPFKRSAFWNPDGAPDNHFELKHSLVPSRAGPFLYVERANKQSGGLAGLTSRFDRVDLIEITEVGPGYTVKLYRLNGFVGYEEGLQ